MSRRKLWELPALHYDEEKLIERRVSWLELFFDLFFVVTIARLAHQLSQASSIGAIGEFIVLFFPLWWVWIGFTYYAERFESSGVEIRLFTFALMIPVIGLAVFAHNGLQESFRGYVLSYAAARMIITALWLRATVHVKQFRPTGVRYIIGFSASIFLVFLSAFSAQPVNYILFGSALIIDFLTPLTTLKQQANLPRFSSSKMPERNGLFVIIVLGEMIVGVVNGLAELHGFGAPQVVKGLLGISLGLGIWWVYFDSISRKPPKPSVFWSILRGYLHLPLVMSIAMAGAGISTVIGHEVFLSGLSRTIIALAIGSCLVSIGLIEVTLKRTDEGAAQLVLSPLIKMVTGTSALLMIFAEGLTSVVPFLLINLTLVLINILYGIWMWHSQE